MIKYAVEYGWNNQEPRLVVLLASSPEGAYRRARENLTDAGFHGFVVSGVREATQVDIDSPLRHADHCSICRSKHGYEIVHACE